MSIGRIFIILILFFWTVVSATALYFLSELAHAVMKNRKQIDWNNLRATDFYGG